jgi:hypothetical protein
MAPNDVQGEICEKDQRQSLGDGQPIRDLWMDLGMGMISRWMRARNFMRWKALLTAVLANIFLMPGDQSFASLLRSQPGQTRE